MGLGMPPQPSFGEAVLAECMSTLQSSDCERPRNPDTRSDFQQVPSHPELATCDPEVHLGAMQARVDERTTLFHHGTFKCPVCIDSPKVFTDSKHYRNHRVKFHKLQGFVCVVCSCTFDTNAQLVTHMLEERHHVKCPSCPQDFLRPSEATAHFTRNHRRNWCVHCGLEMIGTSAYKSHVNACHKTDGIDYVPASSLVEITLNTSFHNGLSDSSVEQNTLSGTEFDDNTVLPDSTSYLTNASETVQPVYALFDSSDGSNSDHDTANNAQSSTNVATSDIDSDSVIAVEDVQSRTEPFSRGSDRDSVITLENVQSLTSIEPSNRESDTDSVVPLQIFKNPFHKENVVFGPGAEELLDAPQIPSTPEQGNILWIGHDVDMYQAMSEKHKKIYRFNCGKCSSSFRNKEMFKRHSRVHEHICKYCFKKFDSLEDFKQHKKSHTVLKEALVCQNCAHKAKGLKSLMVHEMRHRLNAAFHRKMKELVKMLSPRPLQQDFHECKKCHMQIQGFSSGIRHEVWHEWSQLWSTYVAGRIFTKTFTAADSKKFEEAVEVKLKAQWKDQTKSGQFEPDSLNSEEVDEGVDDLVDEEVDEAVDQVEDEVQDDEVDEEVDNSSSTEDIVSDYESESETESNSPGVNMAINGWMSYWKSYLGLYDTPPKWVTPILKELRSKWKLYHMTEQDSLYKQMDQIAFLIRAQRNEVSPGEGPKVLLERIPNSSTNQKISCGSSNKLPEVEVVLVRMSEQKVKESILSHMKHQFSSQHSKHKETGCGPKETPVAQSTDQRPCSSSTPQSSVSSVSRIICSEFNPQTPSISKSFKPSPSDGKAHAMKRALIKKSERLNKTALVGPKSRTLALLTKRKRTLSLDATDYEESCSRKIFKSSEDSSFKAVSPIPSQILCKGIGRPVVILDKLVLPQDSQSTFHAHKSDSLDSFTSSQSIFRKKIDSLIKSAIGNEITPNWVIPQVENVCSNIALSEKEKLNKILQLVNLLEVECGGSCNSVPFVKLNRLNT